MYLCTLFGTAFDEPFIRQEKSVEDGFVRIDTSVLCPVCFHPYFTAADTCSCGGWKPAGEYLCQDCRRDLLRRFTAFADSLTADEEAQLDDWLDGESITNRRNWT